MKDNIANALAESPAREFSVYLLGNVPGLPPIAQSLHILAIAVIMASAVMVNLRLIGLAVPSQSPSEMIQRLLPWTCWALPVNLITGGLFVVARPNRYFYNPVAEWKFQMLVPVVLLAVVLYWMNAREPGYWEASHTRRNGARVIAATSLLLWLGIVLAGRWIAYTDYLYFLYE